MEDIGGEDITTELLVPKCLEADAYIDAKASGILCGGEVVKEVFLLADRKLKVEQKARDGSCLSKGKKIFHIFGKVNSILKAERLALNFLARLSGIATETRRYVEKIMGTNAKIYDTRKTTPLWRELEKYAVVTGGGFNHRFGLWDEVLVKDNHWMILKSLTKHRSHLKNRFASLDGSVRISRKNMPVEVEVGDFKELTYLLDGRFVPDRILLDNFSIPQLKKAVQMVKKRKSGVLLEASGGVTLSNVFQVAKTGVDRISVGAITHSAPALDFSLTVSKTKKGTTIGKF